jgi:hypothetical protein
LKCWLNISIQKTAQQYLALSITAEISDGKDDGRDIVGDWKPSELLKVMLHSVFRATGLDERCGGPAGEAEMRTPKGVEVRLIDSGSTDASFLQAASRPASWKCIGAGLLP